MDETIENLEGALAFTEDGSLRLWVYLLGGIGLYLQAFILITFWESPMEIFFDTTIRFIILIASIRLIFVGMEMIVSFRLAKMYRKKAFDRLHQAVERYGNLCKMSDLSQGRGKED